MHKKRTISIYEQVYKGLYEVMSNGPISQFSKDFVRPHVIKDELDIAYKLMAEDRKRELKALSWSEAVIRDFDV